jgi:hypothetical protein
MRYQDKMNLVKSRDIVRFRGLVDKAPSSPMVISKPQQILTRLKAMGIKDAESVDPSTVAGATMMRGKSTVADTGAGGRANPEIHQTSFNVANPSRQPVELASTDAHERQHNVFYDIAAKYHPTVAFRIARKMGEMLYPHIDSHPLSRSLFQRAGQENPKAPAEEFLAYMQNYLNDPHFRRNLHLVVGLNELEGREAYKHMAKIHSMAHAISHKIDEKSIDPKYIPRTTQAPTGR